ncbi:MAG: hypothetical protein G01um101433_879 [Parcubacteria group bacterium Gr01-1014_33]|nr:MAG: hypothetical protein G01um101433_879 [Parcubacteria group bacterium Gr01-1014_33]
MPVVSLSNHANKTQIYEFDLKCKTLAGRSVMVTRVLLTRLEIPGCSIPVVHMLLAPLKK